MKAEMLLVHFNRISDAPDAVPSLRKFILDLAVRGKLVEQNPTEEPAAELLRRIRSEKARLVRESKLRGQAKIARVDVDEPPFPVPPNWEWVRLIEILNKLTDGTHHSPPNFAEGDFKYITAKNIKPEGVLLEEVTYVSSDVHQEVYPRCNPEKGDILYIKDGATTGVVTINDLDDPFTMLSSVALLKLSQGVYNRLVVEFLRSPFFYSQMRGFMKGAAITRVTLKRMAPALVPLPPTSEQHRIVAKVDELMALCDRLEVAQYKRESRRDRLAAATHHHLNSGADAESLRAHAQFFIGNLPRLTARSDQIKQLRQTILNLAVRGHLVQQNSEDDSIITTLRHILPSFTDHDQLTPSDSGSIDRHLLPQGWAWIKGNWIADFVDPQPSHRTPPQSEDGVPYIGYADITERGTIDFLNARKVSRSVLEEHRQRYTLKDGDFVIGKIGTIGDPFLLPRPFTYTLSANIILVQPRAEFVLPKFLMLFLDSPIAKASLSKMKTDSTHAVFGIKKARELPIPLPTINEQHRIVAKVDELMALCDQLEGKLITAQAEVSHMLESALHNALNEATQKQLTQLLA